MKRNRIHKFVAATLAVLMVTANISFATDVRAAYDPQQPSAGNVQQIASVISQAKDYTISTWFKTPSTFTAEEKLFNYGSDAVRYMYFMPSNKNGAPEFAFTINGEGGEQRLIGNVKLNVDTWYNLIVTQEANKSIMYINGVKVAELMETEIYPSEMGEAPLEVYGTVNDFNVYNNCFNQKEVVNKAVTGLSDADAVAMIKGMLTVDSTTKQKVNLLTVDADVKVSWTSSNPSVISNDGKVTRPDTDTIVTLTATISKGSVTETVPFSTTVPSVSNSITQFSLDFSQQGPEIKDTLIGAFFEDINWGGDAGLYPEKFANRSFEYFAHVWNGTHPTTTSKHNRTTDEAAHRHGWLAVGDASFQVVSGAAISAQSTTGDIPYMNENNTSYAKVTITKAGDGILNYGYGDIKGTVLKGTEDNYPGMCFQKGEVYNFSMYVYGTVNTTATITLYGGGSAQSQGLYTGSYVVGTADLKIATTGAGWHKVSVPVTVEKDVADSTGLKQNGFADIKFADPGTYNLDFISLYPQSTYNNRPNGLRKDLVEKLRELKPGFLRFPGGCIIEGASPDNRLNWKDTVGSIESRKLDFDLWCENNYSGGTSNTYYYQSFGLGYYEYMLLCEDLQCAAVPVFNAGISCELRNTDIYSKDQIYAGGYDPNNVNVAGIQPYINDVIDFIDFCNGDPATNKWAALRKQMGHAEPFNLEYVAVGNEQENYGAYLAYYDYFEQQIHAKYPNVKILGSSGRSSSGTTYQNAWNKYLQHGTDYCYAVDEHGYYNNEGGVYNDVNRYDADKANYKRGDRPNAFFGEYAFTAGNNTWTALAEASLMTGFEKNADVVAMACYAPLFAKQGYNQWNPNAIWFNDSTVYGSAAYYNQKMYANNLGDYQIPNQITFTPKVTVPTGSIGLGTYATAAYFDDLKIVDNTSGATVKSYDFESDTQLNDFTEFSSVTGAWSIIKDTDTNSNCLYESNTNSGYMTKVLTDGADLKNYTLTVKAKKISGNEGFLFPFLYSGTSSYYWLNMGGWGNTYNALERGSSATSRSQPFRTAGSVTTGKWYTIKIVANEYNYKCYVDDTLLYDYTVPAQVTSDVATKPYSSASYDKESNEIIIRAINPINYEMDTKFVLNGVTSVNSTGRVLEFGGLTDASGKATKTVANTLTDQRAVYDREFMFDGFDTSFYYTLKPYSSTIFRISLNNNTNRIVKVLPAEVETKAGSIPTLPSKVTAVYADGHTGLADVKWDDKPDCLYNEAGNYKVIGDVANTSYSANLMLTVTSNGETPVTEKPFTITSTGTLDRTNGVQATIKVSPTDGITTHDGDEFVIFQLMKGNTPVNIIGTKKDITLNDEFSAYFNVDPKDNTYSVKVFVLDRFNNEMTAPISLADSKVLN